MFRLNMLGESDLADGEGGRDSESEDMIEYEVIASMEKAKARKEEKQGELCMGDSSQCATKAEMTTLLTKHLAPSKLVLTAG